MAGIVPTVRAMSMGRELRFVWGRFARTWRAEWKWWLPGALALIVLTGLLFFANDLKWMRWVQEQEKFAGAEKVLGFWGDFMQFNVGWGVVLWIAGAVRRDRRLRCAALTFVLAGALSGVTTRVVKHSAGRARPSTVEKQELPAVSFKGPTTSPKFLGYFSGHTATTFGSAVALVLVLPRVGWVAVLFAGAVGWSRLHGDLHFPSDVLHGAIWGTMWGGLVGGGMAQVRKGVRGRRGELNHEGHEGREGGREEEN